MSASKNQGREPPHLPDILENGPDILLDDDIVSGRVFHGGAFDEIAARRITLQKVRFEGTALCGCRLPAADLEDVVFERCDLSNVDFAGCVLRRVSFVGCKLIGVGFAEATMQDILFQGCAGRYAGFRFASLARTEFLECSLDSADFESARFAGIRFVQCSLRQAQFSGCRLKEIDFRSDDIEGMGARPENLRGAVFSPVQTEVAAKLLGIVIKDLYEGE